jgi:hypothetical protein
MGRGTASVVFRNFRRAIPQEEKGFDPMCDVGVVATMAFIRIEGPTTMREPGWLAREHSGGECETHSA